MAKPFKDIKTTISVKTLDREGIRLDVSSNILKDGTLKLYVDIDIKLLSVLKDEKLIDRLINRFKSIEGVKEVVLEKDLFLFLFNKEIEGNRRGDLGWQIKAVLQIFCADFIDYSSAVGNDEYMSLPANPKLEFLYAIYQRTHVDDEMKRLLPRKFQSFTAYTKFLADNMEKDEDGNVIYNIIGIYYKWKDKNEIEYYNYSIGGYGYYDYLNPQVNGNIWAAYTLNDLIAKVLISDWSGRKKEAKMNDEIYSKLGEEGWEIEGDDNYNTLIRLLKRDEEYGSIYDFDERIKKFEEYYPKLYRLLLGGTKEAKAKKIESAIKGLKYLADAGDVKAAKAIKGLQYLLNQS